MKKSLVFLVLIAAPSLLVARDHASSSALAGTKLFISPMEGELDGFLSAEIVKKKLPFVAVTDEKEADYVLAGASLVEDNKWYHVIFGGKDKNEGNVRLLSVKDKKMVWAGEAGDRSLWAGGLRRGGQRRIADRIVKKMNTDLFK